MFTTDGKGFPSGSNVGGHAYIHLHEDEDKGDNWVGTACFYLEGPGHVFISGKNNMRFLHPEKRYESLSCNQCEAIINGEQQPPEEAKYKEWEPTLWEEE